MTTFLVILVALLLVALLVWYKSRSGVSSVSFMTFVNAVKQAADAGEQAYRAQVKMHSTLHGERELSKRGLALARLTCALFPTAAYVVVDAGGGIRQAVKKDAPVSGKEFWQLASGAACRPLNVTPSHIEYAAIKDDTNWATQTYVDFFNTKFKGNAAMDLASAEIHLAPLWKYSRRMDL